MFVIENAIQHGNQENLVLRHYPFSFSTRIRETVHVIYPSTHYVNQSTEESDPATVFFIFVLNINNI